MTSGWCWPAFPTKAYVRSAESLQALPAGNPVLYLYRYWPELAVASKGEFPPESLFTVIAEDD